MSAATACIVRPLTDELARAEPLFFGTGRETRLFGWLHTPAPRERGARVGVVICNPFGFEEVAAHRGIRTLAAACAANGLPCLRFDYLGCGNSASDAFAEDQFAGWVESIGQAIDALRQLATVDRVVLVGFRLGASLAALASAGRHDVTGLVAISPVVQGRRYLRELRLLSRGNGAAADTDGMSIDLEPSGFLLTRATCAAIAAVDLEAAASGVKRILLIEDPARDNEILVWSERARDAGASVELVLTAGYEALASDPQTSVVPDHLFGSVINHVLRWVEPSVLVGPAETDSPGGCASPGPPEMLHGVWRDLQVCSARDGLGATPPGAADPAPARSSRITERIVTIPASGVPLFGVLTEPAQGQIAGNVLLLNAGAVRNIGPNRFWVTLARSWADMGFRVLRLDLSGLGDSPARLGAREGDSYSPSAVEEVAAALSFLDADASARGAVHLVGLCSGAYQALQCAIAGLPVRSATLINPLAFTHEDLGDDAAGKIASYEVVELFTQYRQKVMTWDFWMRLADGRIDTATIRKVVGRRVRFSLQFGGQRLWRVFGLQRASDLSRDIEAVLRRGTVLNFVFAAEDPGRDLLRRRIGSDLVRLLSHDGFRLKLIAGADHTFSSADSRRQLLATLDQLGCLELGGADGPSASG